MVDEAIMAEEVNQPRGADMVLLGYRIAHSLSPALYAAAFTHLGLPWRYGTFDCPTTEEAMRFLREGDCKAVNVTTPYKGIALDAADYVDSSAQAAMGANLIINAPAGRIAVNTDGAGCVGFLIRSGVLPAGQQAVVCGTGPTALATADSLSSAGAVRVTLLGRSAERTKVLASSFETPLEGYGYGTPEACDAIAQAAIIVDATTLGMQVGDPTSFDTRLLHAGQTVLDTVYGHGESALLREAAAQGCACFDGRGMLIVQAAIALQRIAAELALGCDVAFNPLHAAMANA